MTSRIRKALELKLIVHVEPKVAPTARHAKVANSSVISDGGRLLFEVPHGLGDCMLFTPVIPILRDADPRLRIDVECKPENVSVFVGVADNVFPCGEADRSKYNFIHRVPFYMVPSPYSDAPSIKPARYLRESLSLGFESGAMQYALNPSPRDRGTAEDYMSHAGWQRRRFVLIHGRGKTLKHKKDLSDEELSAVATACLGSGFEPLWLDLDDELKERTRITRSSKLWAGKHPSATVLAALAENAALCVGIDSGPGHIFGATKTPTLIAWKGHHPLNHFGLAHNVEHLLPANHHSLVVGGQGKCPEFFTKYYRHTVYESLADGLPFAIKRTLAVDRKKTIRVSVPQGLGDIFWVYQRLAPLYDTIDLDIMVVVDHPVQDRSFDWVKLLPKVGRVRHYLCTGKFHNTAISAKDTIARTVAEWESGVSCAAMSVNRWLEEGTHLEEIEPGTEPALDVKFSTAPSGVPYESYITVAISAGTRTTPGVWSVAEWMEMIEGLWDRYEIDLPMVVLGASFDAEVCEEVARSLKLAGHKVHKMIGQPAAAVASAIASSSLHIGYQSGLNIVADNYDVPQVMVYFNFLPKMRDSWVKPANRDHIFNCYTFGMGPAYVAANADLPFPPRTTPRYAEAVFIPGAIGDFIAAVCFLTPRERASVRRLVWANREAATLEPLARRLFPAATKSIWVVREFDDPTLIQVAGNWPAASTEFYGVSSIPDLRKKAAKRPGWASLEAIDGATDLGIATICEQVEAGKRSYQWFLEIDPAPVAKKFKLPAKYGVIHAFSGNVRQAYRDLTQREFAAAVDFLRRQHLLAVVVGRGHHPHRDNGILDLTDQTSLEELMGVVAGAKRFIGCSSFPSVVASKFIPSHQCWIKGNTDLRSRWWKVYYAPHESPAALHASLLALEGAEEQDDFFLRVGSQTDGNPYQPESLSLEMARCYGIAWQSDRLATNKYADDYWEEYERRDGTLIGRKLNRARATLVEKYCSSVLDFGIGAGAFIRATTAKVYGYDINPRAEKWLRERSLWHNPWDGLPPDCEGVCFWDVLEHLPRPTAALDLLRSGMHLFLSLPIFSRLEDIRGSRHHKPGEHLVYWTRDGLVNYLASQGFVLLEENDAETGLGRDGIGTFVAKKL